MKAIIPVVLILFFTVTACNKKCGSFTGTWQNENYNAYINIEQNGDIFLVSVKEKTGKQDWLSKNEYVMYYDKGLLRSEKQAFKTITLNAENHTIQINDEKEEWSRVPNKSAM